jgi:hypothetical protein
VDYTTDDVTADFTYNILHQASQDGLMHRLKKKAMTMTNQEFVKYKSFKSPVSTV